LAGLLDLEDVRAGLGAVLERALGAAVGAVEGHLLGAGFRGGGLGLGGLLLGVGGPREDEQRSEEQDRWGELHGGLFTTRRTRKRALPVSSAFRVPRTEAP